MAIARPKLSNRPRLAVLNDEQKKEIHLAALEVLERTGIKMTHEKGLEILSGAGAKVSGNRVRIPSWLVEDAILKAPSRLILGKRNGERSVFLEGDRSFYGPSLDCMEYLDPATNGRTDFTADHCRITASLTDHLPNFDWSMVIGMASDVPPEISDRVIARQALTHSTKPLVFCTHSVENEKDVFEMALAICGGKKNFEKAPTIVHYSEPISPLTYYDPAVDKILFSVENGIPLINFSAPQLGGSSPATFAGTIVQGIAESLSGLVLGQNACPGASMIFGSQTTIMDMRTTIFSYGAPEMALMISAMAEMAQFYELPFFGTAGSTDAKFNDPQAGIEATFQTLTAGLVGSSLVHDCSSWMDHGSLVSPAYMVMVNEILHMVNQYMKGIEISDETLAVDLIDKIGPGGNFISEQHTMDNFKNVWYSDLFDRTIFKTWEDAGSKTFEDRLREKTLKAMAHETELLSPKIVQAFDQMQKHWK
ncbi:trimethylamine methyltransferase family protein [Desulfococcaceae bacterium HSG7]|nr:trimethylamine methyltransferase family protein [Desulfococcaceae bacterium HSG9]MDM8553524.1 trimethylamine methyltransferase family protein [Desulfococcaceae bacterium HSG7]